MSIGARLKEWRARKNLKQDGARSLFGLSISTYQKYEMDISKPGADAMEAFVRAGMNANWLLTGQGPMLLNEAPAAPSPIDMEVFTYVIEGVEAALARRRIKLDATRKATLIQLIYEYCLDTGTRKEETVERFLKLVA